MTKNPILDELHAVREQLLIDAGGTLDALVDRLQVEEQHSNHPRFKPQRTIPCTESAKSDTLTVKDQSSPPTDRSR